ncbi:MAG: dihydrofolate reductase family protein [Acidimicrobiales bacterium]
MRPVLLQLGVTLDGFVHGTKGYEDWGLPPDDDEVVAWKVVSLREAGTHIMGRATYEAMASVWPTATGVYANVMNEIPKVVFSKTLTRADWPESRIASGDRSRNRPVQRFARTAVAGPDRGSHVPRRNCHPPIPTGRGE